MHVFFNDDVYKPVPQLPNNWIASNVTIDTIVVAYLDGQDEHQAVYKLPSELTISGAGPSKVLVKNVASNVEVTSTFKFNRTRKVDVSAYGAGTPPPTPVYLQWMSNRKWDIKDFKVTGGTCQDHVVDDQGNTSGPNSCPGSHNNFKVKDIEIHTK